MADEEYKQRELELKYGFRFKCLDLTGLIFAQLIPWGSIALISYFVYLSVHSLAGQYTFADIGLKFLGDVKISEALAYALAGGAAFFGYKEKRLRQETIERLTARTSELEKKLDPKRSSSGLTTKGKSRSEDI